MLDVVGYVVIGVNVQRTVWNLATVIGDTIVAKDNITCLQACVCKKHGKNIKNRNQIWI